MAWIEDLSWLDNDTEIEMRRLWVTRISTQQYAWKRSWGIILCFIHIEAHSFSLDCVSIWGGEVNTGADGGLLSCGIFHYTLSILLLGVPCQTFPATFLPWPRIFKIFENYFTKYLIPTLKKKLWNILWNRVKYLSTGYFLPLCWIKEESSKVGLCR